MSEKVLIKSERVKSFAPLILLAISAACALMLTCIRVRHEMMIDGRMVEMGPPDSGWILFLRFNSFISIFAFLLVVCGSVCLLTSIICGTLYLVNRKCEICITEYNVKGKTHWGKDVVLPLSMVSVYVTRKFMSTIAVATASGMIKFGLIKNYIEIGDVLSKKINERQKNSENAKASDSKGNNMDDLLKLKSLLDAGVITQEEFEAKKKQLLGL